MRPTPFGGTAVGEPEAVARLIAEKILAMNISSNAADVQEDSVRGVFTRPGSVTQVTAPASATDRSKGSLIQAPSMCDTSGSINSVSLAWQEWCSGPCRKLLCCCESVRICDGMRGYISSLCFTRVTLYTIHKASQVWSSAVCRGRVLELELRFRLTYSSCLEDLQHVRIVIPFQICFAFLATPFHCNNTLGSLLLSFMEQRQLLKSCQEGLLGLQRLINLCNVACSLALHLRQQDEVESRYSMSCAS